MEESSSLQLPVIAKCDVCYTDINNYDSFCQNCGYPIKGTDQEKKNFISSREAKQIDLEEAHKQIKKAGYALYYIAGATLLMGFVGYVTTKNPAVKNSLLIVNTVLALIYGGLGWWSSKKPLAAIISGASLFVLVLILNAIVDPLTIIQGAVLKIFMIFYFVKGMKSAIEADKLKKELNVE